MNSAAVCPARGPLCVVASPGQRKSPGPCGRSGALTCNVVSTNNARPKGFEPLTF